MGVKSVPTFLQSSPYLSNSTSTERVSSSKNEVLMNQGKRMNFADVVSGLTNLKKKPVEDLKMNVAPSTDVQSDHMANSKKTVYDTEPVDSRDVVPKASVRNISTAVSLKPSTASPSYLESFPVRPSQGLATTIVSCMTDRQKRQLTRTILHPDEIDVIIETFNVSGKNDFDMIRYGDGLPDSSDEGSIGTLDLQ